MKCGIALQILFNILDKNTGVKRIYFIYITILFRSKMLFIFVLLPQLCYFLSQVGEAGRSMFYNFRFLFSFVREDPELCA